MIDQKMLQYIAHLARLELPEKELADYESSLRQIVTYIDKLNELDIDDIEPASHAMSMYNVFRDDQMQNTLTLEATFQNAPEAEDGYFRVPKIMND